MNGGGRRLSRRRSLSPYWRLHQPPFGADALRTAASAPSEDDLTAAAASESHHQPSNSSSSAPLPPLQEQTHSAVAMDTISSSPQVPIFIFIYQCIHGVVFFFFGGGCDNCEHELPVCTAGIVATYCRHP